MDYYPKGEYAKFSGTVFATSHSTSVNPRSSLWDGIIIQIYGDDELLYSMTGFDPLGSAVDISVDISGVTALRIYIVNGCYIDTGMHLALIGLGNPTLGW